MREMGDGSIRPLGSGLQGCMQGSRGVFREHEITCLSRHRGEADTKGCSLKLGTRDRLEDILLHSSMKGSNFGDVVTSLQSQYGRQPDLAAKAVWDGTNCFPSQNFQ